MTRGNQRDNDRAKALKKAGNTVRLITPVLFVHTDHFYRRARTPCPVANSLGARKTPLPSCARSRGRVCIPQGARRKSNLHYETGLLITSLLQPTKRKPPRLQQEKAKNNTPQSIDPTCQSISSPSTFIATARSRQPT
jgi:hypothetical protein